jgi:hypothetical protein
VIGWRLFAHAVKPGETLPGRSFAGWHFLGVDGAPICGRSAEDATPSTVDIPMQGFPPVCARCCLEIERTVAKLVRQEARHGQ